MERVLHDLAITAAAECPDKDAVFLKDEKRTYAEILRDSRNMAAALWRAGVRKGDRVGFLYEKSFEKVVSIFGISMAGGVFVPVRKMSLGDQVAHIMADSGATVMITTYSRLAILAEHLKDMPTLKTIIASGNRASQPVPAMPGVALVDYEEELAHAGNAEFPGVHVVEPDLVAILYTSGSTGRPKGVVLTHLNLVAGARTVSEFLKITDKDRLLSILTFGFDYGLNQLTTVFLKRAQLVMLEYLFPKEVISAARKYDITGIATVATTWIQLMQIPWKGEDVPKLRYVTNSGGAIPERFVKEMRSRMPHISVYLMYGLTEAFRSTYLDPSMVDKLPTSMGKAIPGEEIMILDEDNRPVKPGETGELVHRGVLVAQGYWNAPDLTGIRYKRNPMQPPNVPVPEMVVYSGDQVRIDGDGFLFFVGRKDEMIKCSGIRISPTEIEELLYKTGLVHTAMAMGAPHEMLGHSVYVIVVPAQGIDLSQEKLIVACRQSMPPYMVPAEVEIRASMPQNATGKLDRATIKKEVQAKLAARAQAAGKG